jgi:hypothetical protein
VNLSQQAEEDAHAAQQRQQQQSWQRGSGDAAQQDLMRQLQSGVQTVMRVRCVTVQLLCSIRTIR